MKHKQDKVQFPGQKVGLIRVFIKRGNEDATAQIPFHFFDEEIKSSK